jgi:DNA-binding CsgD family transcriptional regulator
VVATPGVRRLALLSEGNPLWLRELVRGAVERGALRRSGSLWRLNDAPLPAHSLPAAVSAATDQLEGPVRNVVATVALDDVMGVRVLEALFDEDVLAAAEARGMLARARDDRRVQVRLAHALYGAAVLDDLPPVRARRLRLRLADAVTATGGRRRQDLLGLARWRLEAGDRTDARLFTDAAFAAGGGGAHDLAERFARAAVDAGGGFSARMALGEALQRTGGPAAAVDELRAAVAAAANPEQGVRAHALLADVLFWWQRSDDAERELRAAEAVAVGPADVHRIAVQRALFASGGGDLEAAARAAEAALVEPSISSRVRSDAVFVVLSTAPPCGRPRAAVDVMQQAGALAASADSVEVEYGYALETMLPHLAYAHWWDGRFDDAEATLGAAGSVVTDNDQVPLWNGWVGGLIELERGRPNTAVRMFEHTVAQFAHVFPEPDSAGDLNCTVWSTLAYAAALTGDHERAHHALAVADATWPVELFDAHRVVARTWVPAARGDLALAQRRAVDGIRQARTFGVRLVEARLLHDLVRFNQPQSAVARLDELACVVDAQPPALYADHARALAAGDPAGLERAASGFESAGCLLQAAEVHVQRAALLADRPSAGAPARARLAARRLASRCGLPSTPALAQLAAPLLTQREREVATLAASGLSDRETANRLEISSRTVSSHLHRSYVKLGINSCRQLRDVIT